MDLLTPSPPAPLLLPSAFGDGLKWKRHRCLLFSLANSQSQDVLLHLIYGLTGLILAHNLELVKCTGGNLLTTVFILIHCREFFKWKRPKKQGHFQQPIMNNNCWVAKCSWSSSSFGFHLIKSFISTGSLMHACVCLCQQEIINRRNVGAFQHLLAAQLEVVLF